MSYYRRRHDDSWGPNPRLERVITVIVTLLIIAVLVLFLFVYHDFPMRIS